ncbi:hypothetical protein CEXT_386231 [Caerostris extrusa]|uniref:Uncharacterized protein n=1 Tax=Caerostris extrusa TaxID=172846 RepID=A0AAV4XR21_CAEEX|nr:hypothetical protein CEXT_386231 [Caerostris extrusa]
MEGRVPLTQFRLWPLRKSLGRALGEVNEVINTRSRKGHRQSLNHRVLRFGRFKTDVKAAKMCEMIIENFYSTYMKNLQPKNNRTDAMVGFSGKVCTGEEIPEKATLSVIIPHKLLSFCGQADIYDVKS